MGELDNIPQKQSIDIESVKMDDSTKEKLEQFNQKQTVLINDFGQIYLRRKELQEELKRLDDVLEKTEVEFKLVSDEMRQTFEELEEKYPQMRVNLQEGVIQYQPGAPTRKQLAEQSGVRTF